MSQSGDILSRLAQAAESAAQSVLAHIQPALSDDVLLWAKAQSDWCNGVGNGSYVECHPCADHTGSDADTAVTLRVYLPRATNTDPNVVTDQVIGYRRATGGIYVAATGYLDDAIGTIKMWSVKTGDPPAGWGECISTGSATVTGLEGRFPVGKCSSHSDLDEVGKYAGDPSKGHCHAMQLEQSSPPCTFVTILQGSGSSKKISMAKTTSPPYCVVRFIERIDNSS